MWKNKIVVVMLALILLCSVSICVPAFAEQSNLTAATSQFSVSTSKVDKTIKNVKKNYVKYKKYLNKKQQKKITSYIKKIKKAASTSQINKYKKSCNIIFKQGQKIKKAREVALEKITTFYKENKKIVSNDNKNKIINLKKKIRKSCNKKYIKRYKEKAMTIINDSRWVPGYDTTYWSIDKIAFVQEWGWRNNNYLAGHGMAGTGYIIATAAWDYGMEPRLCAAIAKIESGCGDVCCGAYNAWGWIWPYTYSFSSWEDGINQWTSYFVQFFGSEVPTWNHGYGGYSHTLWLNEMAKI